MSVELRVGEYVISVVDDHLSVERDVSVTYPDVAAEEWEPFKGGIAFNANGKFQAQWRAHLVRKADGTGPKILVDSGMGPGPHAHGGDGMLLANLRTLGVEPEEINIVVTTHCHGDHIGWNVTYDGDKPRATFPFAKYHIAANDWEHYSKPGVENEMFDRHVAPLEELGVLELVRGEVELAPGVKTLPTNGHTPGHQCVLVESGGQTAVITGDLFHSVAQVTEPHWCPTFDWRTDLSTASRRWLFFRAMMEDWTVCSGHLPTGSSMGKIAEENGKQVWKPV